MGRRRPLKVPVDSVRHVRRRSGSEPQNHWTQAEPVHIYYEARASIDFLDSSRACLPIDWDMRALYHHCEARLWVARVEASGWKAELFLQTEDLARWCLEIPAWSQEPGLAVVHVKFPAQTCWHPLRVPLHWTRWDTLMAIAIESGCPVAAGLVTALLDGAKLLELKEETVRQVNLCDTVSKCHCSWDLCGLTESVWPSACLRGFPFKFEEADVWNFLHRCEAASVVVKVEMERYRGGAHRKTGSAILQVSGQDNGLLRLRCHDQWIETRYIEVLSPRQSWLSIPRHTQAPREFSWIRWLRCAEGFAEGWPVFEVSSHDERETHPPERVRFVDLSTSKDAHFVGNT